MIELVGDLGSGKTQFVRGLAKGIGSTDAVQSPSFTISRVYRGKAQRQRTLELHHFDFYRLDDPGVVGAELHEALQDPDSVVAVEWGETAEKILPKDRLRVEFETVADNKRKIILNAVGQNHRRLVSNLQKV